jgi:hypothetical protein
VEGARLYTDTAYTYVKGFIVQHKSPVLAFHCTVLNSKFCDVLTAVLMKSQVFLHITRCNFLCSYRRFGGL